MVRYFIAFVFRFVHNDNNTPDLWKKSQIKKLDFDNKLCYYINTSNSTHILNFLNNTIAYFLNGPNVPYQACGKLWKLKERVFNLHGFIFNSGRKMKVGTLLLMYYKSRECCFKNQTLWYRCLIFNRRELLTVLSFWCKSSFIVAIHIWNIYWKGQNCHGRSIVRS